VVRGFDLPAKPWLPGHRGVDLAGHPGQPVLAAIPGIVTYAGQLAGRGVITITSGTRRTTYEPVVPEVSVGTTVETGTVIGRLSAAGSHCPPRTCLHWGLLQGKQYLNPLSLLPNRPVRLLPLANQPPQRLPAPTPLAGNAAAGDAGAGDAVDGHAVDGHAGAGHAGAGSAGQSDDDRRVAKLVVAGTATLTLTAGLLIRRE
jgi:hypothetical protein